MLLALAVGAGVAYGWQMGSSIEIFYAAAVRSMSMSWHNFAFAAFDPAGTVSVDKLPGALWIQALSVRLFGVHAWAIALPQAVEGALTVLVLYRTVSRLAGPRAAIVAACVLAVSPATVTLDRGNISDTLLVLLLVLAADSLVAAVVSGRRRSLLMAGLWVGLAFQAKMIEAWLVLPALALTYLVVSRDTVRSRVLHLASMMVVVVVVSLSWMLFVSTTPAQQRPYVDGSPNDSVFEQVFEYNGFGRVGQSTPNQQVGRTLGISFLAARPADPAWNRLLTGSYGRDTGWLLPAALVVLPAALVSRRRRPRTDLVRAGMVMWGTWLLVLGVVFSETAINTYYLGALSPPIAALIGIASKLAWDARRSVVTLLTLLGVVLLTAGYGYWLLPVAGTGLPTWLAPVALSLGVLAVASLVATILIRHRDDLFTVAATGVFAAALAIPVAASVSVVTNNLGAFDTPFQPAATTSFLKAFFSAPFESLSVLPTIEKVRSGAPDLLATQTSVLASSFIYATGEEVLPIGGYTGTIPEPSVADLESMVAAGRFHLVLTGARSKDPRVIWIADHCLKVAAPPTPTPGITLSIGIYYCNASR